MASQGANYTLNLEQDCDYVSPVFTWTFVSTGLPVNITGFTALMKIRSTPLGSGSNPGTVLLTLTNGAGITLGGATGQVVINLTKTQLALNSGTYWFDLLLTSPSNQTSKMLSGPLIVGPTVSQ